MTNDSLYRRTFVGRSNELRQLQSLFDRGVNGEGALAFVVGEPGIGKTALCERLAAYVSELGGVTLVGHCYEEGSFSLPYLAFVEAIQAYVRQRDDEGLRADLGTAAADVARIVPEVAERLDIELRPASDPESDRWHLLQAVTSFLRRASATRPLLIVLEDLHWADRGTLDLLLHLARNLQGSSTGAGESSRLLLVGTYRDVEVDRSHSLSSTLADLQRVRPPMRIPLRGLTIDEVQHMYGAIRSQDVLVAQAEAVHRQTEGNPLFVQEMLRYLVEEGLVAESDGTLRRVGDDTLAGRIPEGLRDVIGKRLTRLGPDANRLLATASVIGRDFRLDVLQRVAAMAEDDIIAALEEAKSAGVVEERSSVGAVVTYRFSHALFSQTLYEEIGAPRRIRLHQQVGRALEEVFSRRLDEHAPELAEHFSHSSDSADLAKAVHYGELAAHRATSVFDYGEATRLLECAIEVQEVLDPDNKAKRCDLLLALAAALLPAGEPLRAIHDVCEPAYLLAVDLQDPNRIQRAIRLASEGMSRYGGPSMNASPTAVLWSERAQSHSATGTVERVWADLETARVKAATRDFKEYRRFAKAALLEARELGVGEALLALAQISVNWISVTDWRELPAVVDEAIAVLKSAPTGGFQGMLAAFSFCRCLLWQGQKQRAVEILQLLSAAVERTKDRRGGLLESNIEGQLAFWEGHLGDALEISRDILTRGEEQGVGLIAAFYARSIAAPTLTYLGRHEEALLNLGDSPALASQRTLLLAEAGRSEDAKDLLIRTMAELQVAEHGQDLPIVQLQLLLESAVSLGDAAICAMLVELLWPLPPLACVPYASPTRVIGDALALLGRAADARAKYEAALNICQLGGFRPEIALTRLGLAELLLKHNPAERRAAQEHLDFAIAEFETMGMKPSLERALQLRSHRRPLVEPKEPAYPNRLSEREVEVLRLIAAGKSNQQIADELVISFNTVQRHVGNILAKTGLSNRTEAAGYARDKGLL